jgi:carbon monoxide dehydrogenase subunit G
MSTTIVKRTIKAPVDLVFKTVSDIRNFSRAIPAIVEAEILTEVKTGVGTRFRETRMMMGKEATTELEVTEFVENDRVRIVADTNGTVWDSVFSVIPAGDETELTLTMEGRAHKTAAKLMTPLIMGMVRKAIEADMQSVKEFCENQT